MKKQKKRYWGRHNAAVFNNADCMSVYYENEYMNTYGRIRKIVGFVARMRDEGKWVYAPLKGNPDMRVVYIARVTLDTLEEAKRYLEVILKMES